MQSMQTDGGLAELEKNDNKNDNEIDSAYALQQYLDHIPISSIPAIQSSQVLELKAGDSLRDAIHMLYQKDIFSAAILDVSHSNTTPPTMTFTTSYIAIIDFSTMVLWCLQEYEKILENSMENSPNDGVPKVKDIESHGFFSILDRFPQIGQTKVGDLAKSFLWEPFFPVRLDDTILHALLLLSKHRLCLLPVTQQPGPGLVGFVTQNAVVQFLLQSSGLEWFDSVADKNLSYLSFENRKHPSCVSRGQSVADALKVLWQNQTCAVAVLDEQTKKLIGNVRNSDVYHLVNNDNLLRNRMILTVEEFIHTEIDNIGSEDEHGGFVAARSLSLKSRFIPKMDSPVTNKENDTLKQIMEHMTQTNSSFSFLMNDNEQVTGLVTLRDIIVQFAPPCLDSSIDGGGFFQFALEQSGCHVKNGTIIRN
ncbi:PREDICTED: SNF1-related protein kinase regulatory subunit gamma-1-like [Lupinus angustifolius]|uniref:SNF1-related protein kinase regulatory subunit gamma-1-like n=1 Tax=Lupinus angustifolius TaxID=3871 RepID=UPI00092E6515|nr:PREDICTED: SNF1-related protein kinase regulatory subunit gamma-1-like [Lupinus angustifolius]